MYNNKLCVCVFGHWFVGNLTYQLWGRMIYMSGSTSNESLTLSKLSLSLHQIIITTIHLTLSNKKLQQQKSRGYWLHYQCTSINYDIPSNRIYWTEPISYYQSTMGFLRMAGHNPHEGRKDGIRLLRIDDDQVIEFTRNI